MFLEFKHWNNPDQNPRILATHQNLQLICFHTRLQHAKITDETIKVRLKFRPSKVEKTFLGHSSMVFKMHTVQLQAEARLN